MTTRVTKKINLALQGGGSHGAFTWGVLDRFLEDDSVSIEGISGVSSGAMNACVFACGMSKGGRKGAKKLLEQFWSGVSNKFEDIFCPAPNGYWEKVSGLDFPSSLENYLTLAQTLSPYQLNPFNLNPIRDLLEELIDFRKLRNECPVKLYIGATQVKTGKLRVFTNQELSTEVMLASSCLPSIHHSIEIEHEHYWDGGYSGNPPVFPLIFNCENPDVLVVLLFPLLREEIPFTADEINMRTSELSFNNTFLREMRAIAFSKEQIKNDWLRSGNLEKKIDNLNLHIIEDREFSRLDSKSRYNTDADFMQDLHSRGYEAADIWLAGNYHAIMKRSTVDLVQMFC